MQTFACKLTATKRKKHVYITCKVKNEQKNGNLERVWRSIAERIIQLIKQFHKLQKITWVANNFKVKISHGWVFTSETNFQLAVSTIVVTNWSWVCLVYFLIEMSCFFMLPFVCVFSNYIKYPLWLCWLQDSSTKSQ